MFTKLSSRKVFEIESFPNTFSTPEHAPENAVFRGHFSLGNSNTYFYQHGSV